MRNERFGMGFERDAPESREVDFASGGSLREQDSPGSSAIGSAEGSGDFLPEGMGDSRVEVSSPVWEAFSGWATPETDAGQIWRLQWKNLVAIAVVEARRDSSTVSALPISEDPQFATDSDLLLQAEETPLDLELMVQVGLEMVVHARVLERCLGAISEQALQDLRVLRNAFVHSESSGLPLGRVGSPVTHELDERVQYRSEQRERHAPLIFAEWYQPPREGRSAAAMLRDLLDEKWTLAELARKTGVSVQTLMRIRRGERPGMTEVELTALARLLGMDAEELEAALSERLPSEIQDAIDLPTHKHRIYRCATEWQVEEDEARRRVGRKLLGLSRRAKGMGVEDWSRLLEELFPL